MSLHISGTLYWESLQHLLVFNIVLIIYVQCHQAFQLFVFCPFVFQVCVVTHLVHLHV